MGKFLVSIISAVFLLLCATIPAAEEMKTLTLRSEGKIVVSVKVPEAIPDFLKWEASLQHCDREPVHTHMVLHAKDDAAVVTIAVWSEKGERWHIIAFAFGSNPGSEIVFYEDATFMAGKGLSDTMVRTVKREYQEYKAKIDLYLAKKIDI